jgi:transcriptional regulator with XRE-family HTH domain
MPQVSVIPEGVNRPDGMFTEAELRRHYAQVSARLWPTPRPEPIPAPIEPEPEVCPDRSKERVWLPIAGSKYAVSSHGEVRHIGSDTLRKLQTAANGYLMVGFWANRKVVFRTVHSLVVEAFIGPRPEGMEIRHLDGNRTNNHLQNLTYGTKVENAADRERHGNTRRGENNGNAVLSDTDADFIRAAYRAGMGTQYELADMFGVSQAQVNNIVLGKQRKGPPAVDVPRVTLARIFATVADYYGVPMRELKSERRQRTATRARQLGMYLARELTLASFPQIARAGGRGDHTTAIHACQAIAERMKHDAALMADASAIRAYLEAPTPANENTEATFS